MTNLDTSVHAMIKGIEAEDSEERDLSLTEIVIHVLEWQIKYLRNTIQVLSGIVADPGSDLYLTALRAQIEINEAQVRALEVG